MKVIEYCSCGAWSAAIDERGEASKRYRDGSGSGFAADFIERWRDQHVCPVEEPPATAINESDEAREGER